MFNFTNKEKRILSITLSCFGIFLIGSGLIMNSQIKPIINTTYTLNVKTKKIAETQAKTNEIKIKNIETEINTPISVDIKDYLEEIDTISPDVLKNLKLDTSLVNITQAGSYQYTISYGKKKYIGTVTVKEKKEQKPPFIVKEEITIPKGGTLNVNDKTIYLSYYESAEVLNNIQIDFSEVNLGQTGEYNYYVIYLDTKTIGKIKVNESAVIPPSKQEKTCPGDSIPTNDTCTCSDINKEYDTVSNTCIEKTNTQ